MTGAGPNAIYECVCPFACGYARLDSPNINRVETVGVVRGHVEAVIAVCSVFVTAQRKVGKSTK